MTNRVLNLIHLHLHCVKTHHVKIYLIERQEMKTITDEELANVGRRAFDTFDESYRWRSVAASIRAALEGKPDAPLSQGQRERIRELINHHDFSYTSNEKGWIETVMAILDEPASQSDILYGLHKILTKAGFENGTVEERVVDLIAKFGMTKMDSKLGVDMLNQAEKTVAAKDAIIAKLTEQLKSRPLLADAAGLARKLAIRWIETPSQFSDLLPQQLLSALDSEAALPVGDLLTPEERKEVETLKAEFVNSETSFNLVLAAIDRLAPPPAKPVRSMEELYNDMRNAIGTANDVETITRLVKELAKAKE